MSAKPKPANFTRVDAREFDPKGKLSSLLSEKLTNIAGMVRRGAKEAPLTVPIDPTAVASRTNPRGAWGLSEAMRLELAVELLHAFETGKPRLLEILAELSRREMPPVTPIGVAIADAVVASEREAKRSKRTTPKPVTKSDLRREISKTMPVPESNKAGAFYRKHGLENFPRGRAKDDDY